MRTVKVNLADGSSYRTGINGTDDEIRAYFVGETLNLGDASNGWEKLVQCVSVELDPCPAEAAAAQVESVIARWGDYSLAEMENFLNVGRVNQDTYDIYHDEWLRTHPNHGRW